MQKTCFGRTLCDMRSSKSYMLQKKCFGSQDPNFFQEFVHTCIFNSNLKRKTFSCKLNILLILDSIYLIF